MSLASELNISFAHTITFPVDGDVDSNTVSGVGFSPSTSAENFE